MALTVMIPIKSMDKVTQRELSSINLQIVSGGLGTGVVKLAGENEKRIVEQYLRAKGVEGFSVIENSFVTPSDRQNAGHEMYGTKENSISDADIEYCVEQIMERGNYTQKDVNDIADKVYDMLYEGGDVTYITPTPGILNRIKAVVKGYI